MNNNELFTLEALGEFYTDAAKAGGMHYWNGNYWEANSCGPSIGDCQNKYRIKPAKKWIIDLSPLIESGIDCEFGDDGEKWQIGSLVFQQGPFRSNRHFEDGLHGLRWEKCRPRMNHIMFHNGGECPLPEGFEVEMYWRDGSDSYTDDDYIDLRWGNTGRQADIIGYKILGLADGYAYPWEQAE